MERECSRVRPHLHDYLEGEVDRQLVTRIESHLKRCNDCQAHTRSWADDLDLLLHTDDRPPERLFADIKRQLGSATIQRSASPALRHAVVLLACICVLPLLAYLFLLHEALEQEDQTRVRIETQGPTHLLISNGNDPLAGDLRMFVPRETATLIYGDTLAVFVRDQSLLVRRGSFVHWPAEGDPIGDPILELRPFTQLWGRAGIEVGAHATVRLLLPFGFSIRAGEARMHIRSIPDHDTPIEDWDGELPSAPERYHLWIQGGPVDISFHGRTTRLEGGESADLTPRGLLLLRNQFHGTVRALQADAKQPWPDVRIEIPCGDAIVYATSNAQGGFQIELPAHLEPNGFARFSDPWGAHLLEHPLDENRSLDVVLPTLASHRAQLALRTEQDLPLVKAPVLVRHQMNSKLETRGTTDALGRVTLDVWFRGPYHIDVLAADGETHLEARLEDLNGVIACR